MPNLWRIEPCGNTRWRRHLAVATANSPSVGSGAGMAGGNSYYAPRLRAAIVGTGGISRIHGWRLQDLGSSVVGVCGRDVAKARSLADEFGQYGDSRVGAFDNLQVM